MDICLVSWFTMCFEVSLRLSFEGVTQERSLMYLYSFEALASFPAFGSLEVAVRPTFQDSLAGETWWRVHWYGVVWSPCALALHRVGDVWL